MARRRFAVALLPPPVPAGIVEVLRRSIGSGAVDRIPPHLTLVPPVNVAVDELDAVHRSLADAARGVEPFELRIGPAATFAPRTPTVHLAVRGAAETDRAALGALRERLLLGPLGRPEPRPFVPHVTLDASVEHDRVGAMVETLRDVGFDWSVRSVHLLEHVAPPEGRPHWVPVREEPLGPPDVVGRGGVQLDISVLGMVDDELASLCGVDPAGPQPAPRDPVPLAVAARQGPELRGGAVGTAATGSVARLVAVGVDPDHRGLGVGARCLAAWCSAAVLTGADLAVAAVGDRGDGDGFLVRHGWSVVGRTALREL